MMQQKDERDRFVIFKDCAPFTKFISKIGNMQVNDALQIDAVMQMYNLIEYSLNYSNTSGSFWQYHRHEPALTNVGPISC